MKGKTGHREKAFTRFLDMSSEANVLSDAGMWLFMFFKRVLQFLRLWIVNSGLGIRSGMWHQMERCVFFLFELLTCETWTFEKKKREISGLRQKKDVILWQKEEEFKMKCLWKCQKHGDDQAYLLIRTKTLLYFTVYANFHREKVAINVVIPFYVWEKANLVQMSVTCEKTPWRRTSNNCRIQADNWWLI